MNEQDKPLILAMHEAEMQLVAEVKANMARNKLPCYLFELIFDRVHRQIKDGANEELAAVSARKGEGESDE